MIVSFAFISQTSIDPQKEKPTTSNWRGIPKLNNPNFKRLEQNCPVFRAFKNHEYRFTGDQLFAVATNLNLLKGGIALFNKIIGSAPTEYCYDPQKLSAMVSYVQKMYSNPTSYTKAFPEVATEYPSMYHAALPEFGQVVVTKPYKPRPLDKAQVEFKEKLEAILKCGEPGVYVLKYPTAFGKTEYLLSMRNVAIAFPRHDLIQEAAARFRVHGADPITPPEYPGALIPPEYDDEIQQLWRRGCYAAAMERLRVIGMMGINDNVTEYVDRKDAIKNVTSADLLLTTHVGALNSGVPHDILIFDEDPLESMLRIQTIRVSDVVLFRNAVSKALANGESGSNLSQVMTDAVEWCNDANGPVGPDGIVNVYPVRGIRGWIRYRLEEIAKSCRGQGNLIDAMQSEIALGSEIGGVRFLSTVLVSDLPTDKKVVVLSATADEWMYRQLLGADLKLFHDAGAIESAGKVICYYNRSFSRKSIEGMPGLRAFLDREFGSGSHRITFKRFKASLAAQMNFGATAGMNTLAGDDLQIIGTHHRNPMVYRLIASVLGEKVTVYDLQMVNQQVERNGLRFWSFTFKHEALRNIHLHLVESELLQAVGRARHLRCNVEVTVYSSLPIPGAEYRRLTVEEIDRIQQVNDESLHAKAA